MAADGVATRRGAQVITAAGRRRLGALLAVLVAALALVLGGATAASAHATLEGTDPAQGSVVPTAPAAVTLTFSEGVSLSPDSVRVLDPRGTAVDEGRPDHVDGKAATARVTLRQGLDNGTYTVAWRAVSEDSHPIGGAFTFSIGAPSDTTVNASAVQGAKADGAVGFAYGTARTVAYGAFALLAGAAAFVIVVWPGGAAVRGVQRLLMSGWVALLLSTVAVLMLRGPYERGTGLGQAFDLSLVRATLDERIGTALAARLLLLAAAGVFLSLLVGQLGLQPKPAASAPDPGADPDADTAADPDSESDAEEAELRRLERAAAERPQRDTRLGLGLAGLALAIALSATWVGADHSSVGIQVPLALPLAALHLLAMAGWLGGLAVLVTGLRHGLPAAAVERFSKLAFWLVAVLAVSGVYQSWRGLGSWGALVNTEYGRLLLIKVGCVAAMLGVAWISRAWTARLRTADQTAAVPESVPALATADRAAGADADPERAAQLARQQAVLAEAKQRRTADGSPVRAGLRRSVLVETTVAVLVLVVTTMLTNSPPGRVAQAIAAQPGAGGGAPVAGASAVPGKTLELKLPYDTGGRTPNAKGTAVVGVNPVGTGPNAVTLKLTDAAGKPVEVPEVQLAFTLPDRDLGPLPVTLQSEGTGAWNGTAQLPLAGEWVVSVTVRSSDIDQVTATQQLKVGQ
ncbi:copper resistance CopC/CopD family protein [Kitasatospora sp. CB01950]|uniref:copper resistance CopC/CopD family protein n=1 Tax=Kitasatospora sp. CB01950 TaxID=1703930 RepID=UPI000959DAC7|nr:FixH family protein [Kitasatospora sp. CB01950]OKJ00020.1 ABC transporter [Kitasatospora sp. CB01950]